MAFSPSATCADVTRTLSHLRSGIERGWNTRVAVAVWLGLFVLSILIGSLITLAVWLRRREVYGPVPFPFVQCGWTTLIAALAGWYPTVLLYVIFRGRLTRTAQRLADECARNALKSVCEKVCGELNVEIGIRLKSGYDSLFFVLIVGVPPLISAVFCAYVIFSLCSKFAAPVGADGGVEIVRPVGDGERSAAIQAAARNVIVRNGGETEEKECPICLEELWSQTVVEIRCGHQFHRNCICRWLYSGPTLSCPMCKVPVVGAEVEIVQP